jgi:hypothetical protein
MNVRRLQVAMDDAVLMCSFQRLRDLACDIESFGKGNGAAGNPIGQRLALDQLHDDDLQAVGFLEAVDRGDVRVIEAG